MKVLVLSLFLPAMALGQSETMSTAPEQVEFALKAINRYMAKIMGSKYHELLLETAKLTKKEIYGKKKLFVNFKLNEGEERPAHEKQEYFCDVIMWYRPWLPVKYRLFITDGPYCVILTNPFNTTAQGRVSKPRHLPTWLRPPLWALYYAACTYNDESHYDFVHVISTNISEVVYTEETPRLFRAGPIYRFYNVPMLQTNCKNKGCEGEYSHSCTPKDGGQTLNCYFRVIYEPWNADRYTLITMLC